MLTLRQELAHLACFVHLASFLKPKFAGGAARHPVGGSSKALSRLSETMFEGQRVVDPSATFLFHGDFRNRVLILDAEVDLPWER
ncbi:hypothetical protein AS156_01485 [Bradyrhizobium macuxiense]|uniref:Uncharacterized protein n=1 Tax=Bradyrhizobium macuxiense TaxID=1755647 RepID=A0A125Q613_9BRAD|nr:hypothetical protein AS156_01485 [Bradyrhizobium macuxiense]